MYLDPSGDVRSCCMNSWQRLGNVADATLQEIWHGTAARALREAVAVGDLGLGCEACARRIEVGSDDAAYLHVFDELTPVTAHPAWPEQLELALSNTCNLRCIMCNGDLSSAIRSAEGRPPLPVVYDDAFFEQLDAFLPHLRRITFLGGEPFLARESLRVMERLVELGLRPSCHVTTNGTRWNDRIAGILAALPVHVAISIDGATDATVESIRVGARRDDLLANVERFRHATSADGSGLSLAYCLMVPNASEFGPFLRWADELDVDVFVNTVDAPRPLSVQHLSDDALAALVAGLHDDEASGRAPTGRNAGAWARELAQLDGAVADRSGTPVSVSSAPHRTGPVVATVVADAHQVVRSVDAGSSPDPLGLLLEPLVGRSLTDVQGALIEHLGAITSSELSRGRDGTEHRDLDFERDGVRTSLHLESAVLAEGEAWTIRRSSG